MKYAPSIIYGHDEHTCWACKGNGGGKLDRHEVFHGPYRKKSAQLGLWVHLCHDKCHINGVHGDKKMLDDLLRITAEEAALDHYGWTIQDFIREFGKNYI